MSGKSLWLANVARKGRVYRLGVTAVVKQGQEKRGTKRDVRFCHPISALLLLPMSSFTAEGPDLPPHA